LLSAIFAANRRGLFQQPAKTARGAPLEKYVISKIDKSYYPQKLILLNHTKSIPEENVEEEVKKREQKFAPSRH